MGGEWKSQTRGSSTALRFWAVFLNRTCYMKERPKLCIQTCSVRKRRKGVGWRKVWPGVDGPAGLPPLQGPRVRLRPAQSAAAMQFEA